ncbi:thioredoxin domain-containing protein [Oleomonas cavernae]|uniref:Thioredoxin domain-containing protein n=1 Tax=Oleomonas cavernae TaxID=2320859 RepID=A0A418WHX4_9PROT|nr:thioredoxin domain-containing protein [Oleomonas cavernae]RJF89646.1 thioredoxin domain-containing protein [Oleomonas cavernae]
MTLSNVLGRETSPYLLQHAENPVHWQPWGPDTLRLAARQDKPILLSVGYAACHWCHVMAHESFENAEIAALMNTLFVNVKVDREERPDIDTIYQTALAALGQQGGWPLTMFLTPSGEPFWGGTYFPPEDRHGHPGFPAVLRALSDAYANDKEAIDKNRQALAQILAELSAKAHPGELTRALLDTGAEQLGRAVDPRHGGLSGAPKFPQPFVFDFLWRAHRRTGLEVYRQLVEVTLVNMAQGGIYDHLRGGFARYSTDDRWLAPHFEKMLYDNALLIDLYTQVHAATGERLYAQRVEETIGWALAEMRRPEGGFAASLDADSEGEEGRFYVWTKAEVAGVLGAADAEFFGVIYDVTQGGNWEGHTILNRLRWSELVDAAAEARLADCRARLLAARNKRVRPGFDDKVLSDWNGLMIAALAHATPVFDRTDWLDAAIGAFDFVMTAMRPGGRLHQSWRNTLSPVRGTIDAVADMARAALALFEATGEARFLDAARSLVAEAEAHYADTAKGGFFLTADDAEALIVRTRNAHDNATPSGNGTMVHVYARIGLLTGERSSMDKAEALVRAFAGEVTRNFVPLTTLMTAHDLLADPVEVVVVGAKADPATARLRRAAYLAGHPDRVVLTVEPGTDLPAGHPAHGRTGVTRPTAYVCRGRTCSLPLEQAAAVTAEVAGRHHG